MKQQATSFNRMVLRIFWYLLQLSLESVRLHTLAM